MNLASELQAMSPDGQVVSLGHRDYDTARAVWNGIYDRRPDAILRAASEQDVIKAIQTARDKSCLLAVRGGGHSLPGFSTCDGGIVLDLSRLSSVTVDPKSQTARLGGGALLGDLDRATVAHGLVTPAGVVSHTGVAGLTLGGGMGRTSRRLGLAIDSLLSARLVLADGNVITCSAETQPDLFWALRGGGGNFGVVTEFLFQAHDLGQCLVGSWSYAAPEAASVLRGFRDLAAEAGNNLTASFVLTRDGLSIMACWIGSGNPGSSVEAFGKLGKPIREQLGGVTFLQLQSQSDEHVRWGRRYYAKGGFFAAFGDACIADCVAAAKDAPTADSEIYALQLGGAISDVGEEATAYSGRAAKFYWIVQPIWDQAKDDAACLTWGRSTAARLVVHSMATNYVNEQADAIPDLAGQAYGESKYRKLARVKAKYDPGNLFRLNQNIKPMA